ncbi:MAG TPA: AI-2E family transporter [Anaerolineales bacterium]|nr:AI-2E family transporter [Anaerolineales bacterium]
MAQKTASSPRWTPTTKLLVGLVILGILTFLVYRFSNLIGPLLMIFIITYLLHPLTAMISRTLGIPWKVSVTILFILLAVLLIGLLTWGGVGLVGQIQNLVRSIQGIIRDLPRYITEISTQTFVIGPYELDMTSFDLTDINQQLLTYIEPLLGQTGNLLGTIAGSAAGFIGWTIFVLTVSYFVMAESSGLREDMLKVEVPGYTEDIRRLGIELSRIWNAFLRGQIIIFLLTLVIYSILLPALSVRYALGLAFMAALAKFLPYVGPAITWVIMALVTYFQPFKPFGLEALPYMLIVVISTAVIDWFMDNFISPRIMAHTLKVHPGAVLIAAIIAANLLGILGVIIAAPFLATTLLLGRYVMRKMLDLNPWPKPEPEPPQPGIREIIANFIQYLRTRFDKNTKDAEPGTDNQENQGEENEQQPG